MALQSKIHLILRISSSLCFIGHGAWGIITKAEWLPFFAVFNISHHTSYFLMPLIGMVDIFLGILILLRPYRWVMFYMVVWAVFTALLRPLAGFGYWEFVERAGNYGAPFAFLILCGKPLQWKIYFTKIEFPALDKSLANQLIFYLKIFTALLLIGHGGYGAFDQKPMLIEHFRSIGFTFTLINEVDFIICFGLFEIALGVIVFIRPLPNIIIFIVAWKILSEFLYVLHGPFLFQIFEFIERWCSYGVPLALYYLIKEKHKLT